MFCDGTLLSTVTLLLAQHEISSRFLKFAWKRLQPAQINPGSWLSIRVLPCQPTPIFVQVCNSCLMPKSGLFPYLLLLVLLGLFIIIFGAEMFELPLLFYELSDNWWKIPEEKKERLCNSLGPGLFLLSSDIPSN